MHVTNAHSKYIEYNFHQIVILQSKDIVNLNFP